MHILMEIFAFVCFVLQQLVVSLVNLYMMYVRVGLVWRQRRGRSPSMERRDLVMQLAPQSPVKTSLDISDMILTLNISFLDRALWKGLQASRAQPSAVVTGVSYGGIGFYTALNLILCGFNVHGVGRSLKSLSHAGHMIQAAVERQSKLHKDWVGKTGHLIPHLCDMSNTSAISNLCSILSRDPDIRVVVCNAGPRATPPRLSPQGLEEQLATHYVGHSLLMLRLLQHRLQRKNVPAPLWPHWRFVVVSCGAAVAANPNIDTVFCSHEGEAGFFSTFNRYEGYSNAEMYKILFALALSRFVGTEPRLASFCSVNIVDPGPTRSRAIRNSGLPLGNILDSKAAGLLCLSPVISSLYVTDICLSKRLDGINGHFFRMGDDQTARFPSLQLAAEERAGYWVNSPLFCGTPRPAVSLSKEKQDSLWRSTLSYFTSHALLETRVFC